ncbi:cytochrome d ubiquinol oxidase subunit II [Halpernia frigidisoli]|uniref:Cytochrome bd-I ubiquinol oxidase subunit 2 apoprotein n=1 Tax=Halpernia frigidisoli TaxID=1125876 RepID=A0A1I3DR33_9FLAO|nr:cytochrome d ubiquinol oxidase subunit II [Halpernia frigidisoli]SFH88961.1 cytochrome bd-I ubiquinol oxidase subunit 2 apoprotein [Halpernia frigidisoli]
MQYVVIIFLWVSIALYIVLGGADFGAGIVELFTNSKEQKLTKKIMYESIAPVWEANHMWLIIAIVILFVGFPNIYATLSIYLHIPLALMLVGIIARGTAFTFRHYDAVKDNWQKVYTEIFYFSSLLTPFFLGIIAATSISGSINPDAKTFVNLYIFSWLNWFGVSVGLFTVAICSYLASIFSLREVDLEEDIILMLRKSRQFMGFVFVSGVLVFIAANASNINLLQDIISSWISLSALILASLLLITIFICLKKRYFLPIRFFAGFQIVLVLVAASYQLYPNIFLLANGKHLSLLDNIAPQKTVSFLAWALMIGSVFILPFLFYLMFSFSRKKDHDDI